jgi:signal transduction histidine kinase
MIHSLEENDLTTRANYLRIMIWAVLPLVIAVGLLGVPLFTKISPYWLNPTVIPASSFIILSLVSYLFVQKRKYITAVYLYAYGFIFAPFAAVILYSPEYAGISVLMTGGIIVSSVMFKSQRAVYICGLVSVLAVLSLFLILPESAYESLFYDLCVIITLIALILIFKNVNAKLEKAKLDQIQDVNESLIDQTIQLEEEIEKRKVVEIDLKKAKEKAEESDQLKSAFLASMNHELRTPLNHILGFSSLINGETSTEDLEKYSAIIHDSGKNLLAIIEDIFSLAMPENNSIRLRLENVKIQDLFDMISEILEFMLKGVGKENDLLPEFVLDKSLAKEEVSIDKYKVLQIVTNLINNAVKFTDSGKIKIEIFRAENKNLVIAVSDTGIGIEQDNQENIFQFFRQANQDISSRYGGLGIGLSISKRIADVMNAELELHSEPGVGSQFLLHLPEN